MSRQDQRLVTVILDPDDTARKTDLGTWDNLTGGNADSEESIYYPGGMGARLSLGGRRTIENITISRYYKIGRDPELLPKLLDRRGRGILDVTDQPLDVDGNIYGTALVYRCTLKAVNPPDAASESTDVAMIEIEATVISITTAAPASAPA